MTTDRFGRWISTFSLFSVVFFHGLGYCLCCIIYCLVLQSQTNLERYSVSPVIFDDAGKTTTLLFICLCSNLCKPLIISSADERRREEAALGGATLPPSVVISSETPLGKPITKTVPQSFSKQGSRVPSPGSTQRQSPTQELEQTVPPKEKPAVLKPNASIFLQTANFLLEVNALQVQGKKRTKKHCSCYAFNFVMVCW